MARHRGQPQKIKNGRWWVYHWRDHPHEGTAGVAFWAVRTRNSLESDRPSGGYTPVVAGCGARPYKLNRVEPLVKSGKVPESRLVLYQWNISEMIWTEQEVPGLLYPFRKKQCLNSGDFLWNFVTASVILISPLIRLLIKHTLFSDKRLISNLKW